jgi:TrpR family trp operon transcriptional repressor
MYSNVCDMKPKSDDLTELIDLFCRTNNYEQMQKLFEELFTQREKYDFALRWRLMKDLHKGKTQRDIAQSLGISLCKITRGSKILKDPASQFNAILEEYDHDNNIHTTQ